MFFVVFMIDSDPFHSAFLQNFFSIFLGVALRSRYLSVINGNPSTPLRIAQRHCWTIVLWNGYEKGILPLVEIRSACRLDRWRTRGTPLLQWWRKIKIITCCPKSCTKEKFFLSLRYRYKKLYGITCFLSCENSCSILYCHLFKMLNFV